MKGEMSQWRKVIFGIAVGLILYLTTIGIYVSLVIQKRESTQDTMKLALSWLDRELSLDFQHAQASLSHLGLALEYSHSDSAHAKSYSALSLDETMGFEAIAYIAPEKGLVWQIWASKESHAVPLAQAIDAQQGRLQSQNPTRFVARFEAQDLIHYGFLLFEPLMGKKGLEGWLIGFIQDSQLFHDVLADLHMSGYEVAIEKDNELLQPSFPNAHFYKSQVSLEGVTWPVRIAPSSVMIGQMTSSLPEIVLGFGLALSTLTLLVILTYLKTKENQKKSTFVEKRLETLIQVSLDGIITGNLEGNILGWNEGAGQIFGYDRDEVVGRPFASLLSAKARERWRKMLSQIQDKEKQKRIFESSGLRNDGSEVPIECSLSIWKNGTETFFTVIVRDVSKRKQAEERMLTAKANAETANRSKSQFLSKTSYDMRTPLTSILGYSELLLAPETPKEQYANYARIIQQNGTYLLCLIRDLLDLTDLETNKLQMDLGQCSPRAIVEEVSAYMAPFAEAKKLTLGVEYEEPVPDFIYSDPKRISQILGKLVHNAIKYTETGSVRIVCSADKIDPPSEIQFRVIDTGVGITQEVSAKLFEALCTGALFVSEKKGGQGLGLALVKMLTDLLGGKIFYHSEPGFGSTFVVKLATNLLPKKAEDVRSASKAVKDQPDTLPLKKMRILLTEDNDDARQLMILYLDYAGATVDAVDNGLHAYQKGLEALEQKKPYDIILMDIDMPGMNGLEVTQKLRYSDYRNPIVAFTAYSSKEEEKKCLAAGCDAVIVKPISRDELLKKLSSYYING